MFKPTPHAVLRLPTPAQARAMGPDAWLAAVNQREEIIAREGKDPMRFGYEPPIWLVTDALMGFPWVPPELAERYQRALGFKKRVSSMLLQGGNRAGKSQYAAKRAMMVLRVQASRRVWAFHQDLQMSREYQQPLFWFYMPEELRAKDIKSSVTYIAYKVKTGFSDEKFVLPNRSECSFRTYESNKSKIEGGNIDLCWCDELVPSDWVETLELRIAERAGWVLTTFTPIDGYTETVRMFADGGEVVRERLAYVLPKDGGPALVARMLGLSEDDLLELQAAEREGRAAYCPRSVPEECAGWLEDSGRGKGQRVEGREFETVPRVVRCADAEGKRAMVYFHSTDNPFGNPLEVWRMISGKRVEFVRERYFGVANKTHSARFPKFNREVHVVPAAAIPAKGDNYHLYDPARGRNAFMVWMRVTEAGVYVYREWPGSYYIPGIGVPGPWAQPDGKLHDGRMGPAQQCFGWSYLKYKEEIARLEGWEDAKKARPEGMTEKEWLMEWDQHNGSADQVRRRIMDSRAASDPRMEGDRPVTLLTEYGDIGLHFEPAPGDDIDEGVADINNALYYDELRPLDLQTNMPRLLVSAECTNTIFALTTWTGMDGFKGACKDPVDLLRYFFRAGIGYVGENPVWEEGGGYY